jgi:PDZ domain-containing protein
VRRLLVVLLLVGGLTAVARGALPCDVLETQPTCLVALRPGPVEDALELTAVSGARTYGSAGEMLLTTVAVDPSIDLVDWVIDGFDPSIDLVSRDRVYPPDTGEDEVRREQEVLMRSSQTEATLAALTYLGYDLDAAYDGAEITALSEPTSVEPGQLEPGDVIVAVDGEPTLDNTAVGAAVRANAVGDTIEITFRRGERELTTEVELIASPDDPDRPIVGVLLTSHVDLPVAVDIDAGNIGGPSAGLSFALAIVDELGEEDLTGGAVVAGTGTIDAEGRVGAIGGVVQKVVGSLQREDAAPATVFLVPRGNLDEARGAPVDRELLLVPVDTLADAVDALRDLNAGRTPDGTYALGPASRP